MSKLGIVVAAISALAAASIGIWGWISLGHVDISTGGYLALIFGALVTFGLGGGLMALLFYSSRKGFDEAAGGQRDDHPKIP
jgi:hypothetical protein